MTESETQLMQECEFYRMRAAELEKTEKVVNQIKDIIENAKQRYGEVLWQKANVVTNSPESHKRKALVDLQNEIEQMLQLSDGEVRSENDANSRGV
jgi:hypothetical protein